MRSALKKFAIETQLEIISMGIKNEGLKTLFENFLRYSEEHLEEDSEKMHKQIDDEYTLDEYDQEFIDLLHEDIGNWEFYTKESEEILTHVMIIGLYSNYEKTLKKILKLSGKFSEIEIKTCSIKPKLIETFISKGLQYEKPEDSDYKNINELREINNCLKHSGEISRDLHQIKNDWVEGQILGDLSPHFIRLMRSPSHYLTKIVIDLKTLLS